MKYIFTVYFKDGSAEVFKLEILFENQEIELLQKVADPEKHAIMFGTTDRKTHVIPTANIKRVHLLKKR